jgi:hypothetical protein
MELIETVLRGHDEAHEVGIDQGGCYSPDALNTILHVVHDVPLDAWDDALLWHRYADNLVYVCQSVSEGRRVLARVRRLLRKVGLSLKGKDGIGSGQSNMEMGIAACDKAKEEISAANYPKIRLMLVPKVQVAAPAKDVKAEWVECSPKTVAAGGWDGFSAALYYFGQRLHKELDVPVGLIDSSWGGSPIEPRTVSGKNGGGMYNGMIAPVKPLAIRGVIWYQGESNCGNGLKYYDKMKALIEGWHKVWGYDFPFYFVQLAPWSGYKPGSLPPLWEAQVASLKIPGTGMAVTTDIVHNIGDIHPRNKFDVGNRLGDGVPPGSAPLIGDKAAGGPSDHQGLFLGTYPSESEWQMPDKAYRGDRSCADGELLS